MKRVIFAALFLVLTIGCGGKNEPEWTIKGGEAFPGDKGKVIYGVGRVPRGINDALGIKAADTQARKDIAAVMETYIAGLTKVFQQETQDLQNPDQTESVALFSDVTKEVTSTTIQGVTIADHYSDEKMIYSLAKLSIDDVLNAYKSKAHELARQRKAAFIEGKAEDAMKALDDAIDKKMKVEGQ